MNRNLILHRDERDVWARGDESLEDERRWVASAAAAVLLTGLGWWAFARIRDHRSRPTGARSRHVPAGIQPATPVTRIFEISPPMR